MTARRLMGAWLLVAGACQGEPATPAAEPAASPTPEGAEAEAGDEAKAAKAAKAGADGESPEAKGDAIPPPSTDEPSTTRGGGLASMTRDIIEKARFTSAEPLRLIPDTASFAGQMQIPAMLGHPEIERLWQNAVDQDADMKAGVDIVKTCMERLEAIETIAIGFDSDKNMVIAARGTDLGTESTWRCFDRETRARDSDLDLEITGIPIGEGPQLREIDEDDPRDRAQGYFVDRNTVVMVSKFWDSEVRALIRGEGTPAIDGRLRTTATRVEHDSALFLVGIWEGKARADLSSMLSGIEDVAFRMLIEDEALVTHTSTDAGSASDATRLRDALDKEWKEVESLLPMMGFPGSVGPKIEFVAKDEIVSLDLTLTRSELEGFRTTIEGMMK